MEFRMTIGTRLKSERERLGLTLPEFAELAGAKKNTVIDWQRDASSPPAAKLAALADAGVDPLYVLTDRKSTRLNSSHSQISYAVFCLKKKKNNTRIQSSAWT